MIASDSLILNLNDIRDTWTFPDFLNIKGFDIFSGLEGISGKSERQRVI